MVLALVAVVLVAAILFVWKSGELKPRRVPVLIYHRLVPRGKPLRAEDRGERGCIVFDDEFRDHLRALRAAGYRSISPEEFLALRRGDSVAGSRPVMITFDDGWRSVHELALPALRDAGMSATVFMNTERSNPNFLAGEPADGPLTTDMLRDLDAAGVTIGSHGATHRFLTTCDDEELRRELVESKTTLEEIVGKPVLTLAAPGGQSDDRVVAEARRAGYTMLFGGGSGTIGDDSDLFALRRLGVERDTPGPQLVKNLRPGSILGHRLVRELKLLPTRVFGPRVSNDLRRRLIGAGFGWALRVRFLKIVVFWAAAAVALLLVWLVFR